MMTVQRVEKHKIKPSNKYYAMLDNFCFLSKNLYNHANYILRQKFINLHKAVPYRDLYNILKSDDGYPNYRAMPTAQSAQQVLRLLDKNWKSFLSPSKTGQKKPR